MGVEAGLVGVEAGLVGVEAALGVPGAQLFCVEVPEGLNHLLWVGGPGTKLTPDSWKCLSSSAGVPSFSGLVLMVGPGTLSSLSPHLRFLGISLRGRGDLYGLDG